MTNEPLVSVLTPVYNGESYLDECIQSVLSQTYPNFEYIILNNRSKDRTLEIAQRYASSDKRIRVVTNDTFLDIISNHNQAFRLISPQSKYTKIVSADDWLFPPCLTRMVEVAEANPSVGLVSSYQLSGGGDDGENWCVKFTNIPYPSPITSGRKVGRAHLLGQPYVFGSPTSTLYRSDLVRKRDNYYPNSSGEADTSSCYEALMDSDFGFVHEVLSYERQHDIRQTTKSERLNAYMPSRLSDLIVYGRHFLSPEEYDARFKEMMKRYYDFLAISALKFREKPFWEFHKSKMAELGNSLDKVRLSKAMAVKVFDMAINPGHTIQRLTNGPKVRP